MTRRCSHCSNNGHNSRTCPNRGVRLFGVRLTDGSIRKSASMGNLTHYASSNSGGNSGGATPVNGVGLGHDSPGDAPDHAVGYASEDFVAGSSSTRERKKGVPWTEEEHKMFLLGLQKLGKGDWRGISRNYVITRTPTQVASHAQKYFIRHSNVSRRKRRSSLFDIVSEESAEPPLVARDYMSLNSQQMETQSNDPSPPPPAAAALPNDEVVEVMDSTSATNVEPMVHYAESSENSYPVMYPAYVAPYFPLSFPVYRTLYNVELAKEGSGTGTGTHEVLKPRAVHLKSPLNVDELLGISKLSLGESSGVAQPQPKGPQPSLSLNLVEGSTRQSAFQPSRASGSSSVNPIHAV